ncbi:DNA-binding response regulator [Bacillus sp. AFS073361]|uniref:response regulator transcription factor n=1 Tax=Bacillus sp. AFS073361 TaxID=2033511 RepID=UPI000BF9BD50|nr:response regulator transcription factor [Bacillus sp. AFS073361]PFP31373.1 DNA-binding response regulator [Bacillus sp. AFS073361]
MTVGELCRTLIVDDEMLIRQGIKHYINWEQEGFMIVGEASNGQEALELIEATDPHIIITDIVMPIMDGEELTRIVKERYPHKEIIILSSFGEFDYVRSTFQSGVVDYILKPKLNAEGLLKALKTAANRIPAFQKMDQRLTGNLPIGQIIDKLISGYEVNYNPDLVSQAFPFSHFCLIGVDLRNRHQSKKSTEFKTSIKREIEEAFQHNKSQAVLEPLSLEENIIGYLMNMNIENFPEVIKMARQLDQSIPGISLVLTEAFTDLSLVGNMYKEGLIKLLDYRFYFFNQPLLMVQDLPNLPSKPEKFNLDWFTEELKRKHFDSAFQYLQEHIQVMSSCYTMDVLEYKAFFGNIIFNITILLSNMKYDVSDLENAKYSYFRSIDEAPSATATVELMNHFIEEAKKCIFSVQSEPEDINMKKLMEYIGEYYAEPLTLTGVAKHFHFNPSYLSNYFSTHSREGFIEYLNRIRIEEATKLLMEGTESISEISGMVGYSDHSYFCKVFKKIKGLSPSQYKRQQKLR